MKRNSYISPVTEIIMCGLMKDIMEPQALSGGGNALAPKRRETEKAY